MSTSETDSEPEPEPTTDTVSSLTAFAHLSSTRPSQAATGQRTVTWAVDTLAALDFRLVRKDTALHGLIQNCANTMFVLFNTLLQQEHANSSCSFLQDVANILRPSSLHLLFQYRRLFRALATRDSNSGSAPLTIVCWVDVILAKLGDVVAVIATGHDRDHPDRSLPEPLKVRREEDNLRAAMQLPDNWDMLPSVLLSERISVAAKRLSTRLLLGRYILYPALSGQVSIDKTMHNLLSTFAELVRQNATRVDGLRPVLEPHLRHLILQERLTSAMVISLFAAASTARDSTVNLDRTAAFCPDTMAAAMQLLHFVLNEGRYSTGTDVLSPLDKLDVPTRVIIRWEIVPQWTWSIWLQYRSLYADTIMCLTTTYIRHYHGECPGTLQEVSELMSSDSRSSSQAAVISMLIDLVFRFISVLSTGGRSQQLSTNMMSVLHGSCRLISQWMDRNSCGIQNSEECCKALIILFGYLSWSEQDFTLNEIVIECLTPMRGECIREAWKAAVEDDNFHLLEALDQSFIKAKTALSWDNLPTCKGMYAAQLMQFLVVMMSKGARPLDPDAFVEFIDVVGEQVFKIPLNDRGFLCETFLVCLATANLSKVPFSKVNMAANNEATWHLGMSSGDVNLFLVSAFALYIASAPVSVEPLTYLEGLEYLVDIIILICSQHYPREDEPLALIVLPTICDALAHLLEYKDNTTGEYTWTNTRLSALGDVLRSLEGVMCEGHGALLKRRLSLTARMALWEMNGATGETLREHELAVCRLHGRSHLLYVRVV